MGIAKKVVIVRHSLKGPDGKLNEEGVILAEKTCKRLKKHCHFTWVISSLAERAIKTANIITEGKCPVQIAEQVSIPENELKTVLRLFGKLGNQPLKTYYAEGAKVEKKLSEYGQEAWKLILGIIARENCILVVGHEVLIAAIGAAATNRAQLIMDTAFKECEGFVLTIEDNQVTAVRLLKN